MNNDEKTIYDDEKTQYQNRDDEATQYDESHKSIIRTSENTTYSDDVRPQQKKKNPMWQRVAAGAGTGVVLGAVATMLTSGTPPISQVTDENGSHPDWIDGKIPIATSVDDDMTFSEAFDVARTEIGHGGVFEWHGYIYSTYTEDEWNSMTAEQRAEYGSHFKWNSEVVQDYYGISENQSLVESDVDIIDGIVVDNHGEQVENMSISGNDEIEVSGVVPESNDDEVDVEILGVVHEDASGANIGEIMIDNQDVILVNVDGNNTFDFMGTDVNSDGQIAADEFVDISDQNITVDDLGGLTSTDESLYASNNEIDYVNDSNMYEV